MEMLARPDPLASSHKTMDRSEMMAAVRSKDTQPEMLVRRLFLHDKVYPCNC